MNWWEQIDRDLPEQQRIDEEHAQWLLDRQKDVWSAFKRLENEPSGYTTTTKEPK